MTKAYRSESGSGLSRAGDVLKMFERQVERTPAGVAVVCGEERLSYSELNKRANQLAHYLREQGVGAEVRVALCAERGGEMLVAILGILKAGGAYVPLDPSHPTERLRYMLEDAQARLLITDGRAGQTLSNCGARHFNLDRDANRISERSEANPDARVRRENLAYVIYTSGSTGRPKGVGVTSGNVARLFAVTQPFFGFNTTDVWTLFHSYAFDFSVWELWGSLAFGGTLVIVPFIVSRTPQDFYEMVARHRVTVLNLTPSAFEQFARIDEKSGVELALKYLIFGGEALECVRLRNWFERHGDSSPAVINMYGITETTVHVTLMRIAGAAAHDGGSVIGRPLKDLSAYVLGEECEPVPARVPGELYVGGAGLARGYLGRPDLTAERFVPNPFSSEGGDRLYRTGDRVQWFADGNLEYLGRIDDQVKLRGFRIELGEIEAALTDQSDVSQAKVVLREDRPGEKRLVAYVVNREGAKLDVGGLRTCLKQRLPEYMVPSAIMVLPELPLTPNGKLDRRALPVPVLAETLNEAHEESRSAVEEILCGILEEVLGAERVGVQDNLFEMGMHSLLATQVMSRVREVFKVEVPLRNLFESPTIAGLARILEQEISNEGKKSPAPPLISLEREQERPLSFAQQRLWFIHQLDPRQAIYNVSNALRVRGAIDEAALEKSLAEVVRRHDVLRTSFPTRNGEPVQRTTIGNQVWLERVDLAGEEENIREKTIEQLVKAEAELAFDLATGPLLRAKLVKVNTEENILLLTMHHIITDGWSLGILVREMRLLYRAFREGAQSPLKELPIQYADFAAWQRKWLQGDVLEEQLSYWRKQLAGLSPLELSIDRVRPAVPTYRGKRLQIEISKELTAKLKTLSRREGVTMFMTVLAATLILLSRWSGQKDVAVGTDVANRNRLETESLIGFFVNQLVLRTDLRGDPSFLELLARTRDTTLGAYGHQDLPFEKLVEELKPDRDLNRHPLFQVKVLFQNAPRERLELGQVALEVLQTRKEPPAKLDMTFIFEEQQDTLSGMLEYAANVFEAGTAERMVDHLRVLLESVAERPDQRIGRLTSIREAERTQLIDIWNDTEADRMEKKENVQGLIERQVEETPAAVAVICGEERLSYAELNGRANQLAWYLRERGVGPEVRVGICMERSVEMVVGLLGIMKAGGAYVPLDPGLPEQRLHYILQDAQAHMLLTTTSLLHRLPSNSMPPVCLDLEWENIRDRSEENPPPALRPENLVYVIYTSGSTGQPKGVAISHGNLSNYLLWAQKRYIVGALRTALVHSPLSFDLTVTSLLCALVSGLTAELAPVGREIEACGDAAERGRSLLKLTPSHLRAMVGEGRNFGPGTIAVIGGEALDYQYLQGLDGAKDLRIVNEYGPTETTVGCCVFEASPPLGVQGAVPIGKPIANTRLYVWDEEGEITGIGVPGELCIGGDGLARGYLGRPALTAERFVPDRFGKENGARLYRTGDLVRWRTDGNLEYLGRIDDQVKLRGYRIELGEVEAVLAEHDQVQQAAAVLRTDENGEKRLVAYVVSAAKGRINLSEVRNYLRFRLPEYMIPSWIIEQQALPLTSNGKLDRRALAALEQAKAESGNYVEPRTPVERIMCTIWAEVLRLDKIGTEDNFFELGGHSLLAAQVMSRARDVFGIELPLHWLFEKPTIASLARLIQPDVGGIEDDIAIVLNRVRNMSSEETRQNS